MRGASAGRGLPARGCKRSRRSLRGAAPPRNDKEFGSLRRYRGGPTRTKVHPARGCGAPICGIGTMGAPCRAVSDLPQGRRDAVPPGAALPTQVEVRVSMSTSPLPLHAGSTVPAVAPAAPLPTGADMGFGQGFAQPETGVDWRRVLSAVARFKWLIAVVTIVGTV